MIEEHTSNTPVPGSENSQPTQPTEQSTEQSTEQPALQPESSEQGGEMKTASETVKRMTIMFPTARYEPQYNIQPPGRIHNPGEKTAMSQLQKKFPIELQLGGGRKEKMFFDPEAVVEFLTNVEDVARRIIGHHEKEQAFLNASKEAPATNETVRARLTDLYDLGILTKDELSQKLALVDQMYPIVEHGSRDAWETFVKDYVDTQIPREPLAVLNPSTESKQPGGVGEVDIDSFNYVKQKYLESGQSGSAISDALDERMGLLEEEARTLIANELCDQGIITEEVRNAFIQKFKEEAEYARKRGDYFARDKKNEASATQQGAGDTLDTNET